jgi:hypothetical protein
LQSPALHKRWLTLKEAAYYSSIGKSRLISMAKEGTVKGFQDTDSGRREWIFDILSIDTYRERQSTIPTYHEKALAILSGVHL